MRKKLIRLSEDEHKKLFAAHKTFFPESYMYVPVAESIMKLVNMYSGKK